MYDCPMKKCDKLWLYEGLKKYGNVRVIPCFSRVSYFRILRFLPRLGVGKIVVVILMLIRSIVCIFFSNKDDIVVVWSNRQGYVLDSLCRKLRIKRKIVSFNWIHLIRHHKTMVAKSFNNDCFMPIINNRELKDSFIRIFDLKKWNGLFLPDVFDDKINFKKPTYKQNGKYIFAGGSNNRDWGLLMRVAEKTPNIEYVIVCDKGAIREKHLKNVVIKENIKSDEYYFLMEKAYLTVCPLVENRSSGLINIAKSAQFGIPCICTRFGVTKMYYSRGCKKSLLYESGNFDELKNKIVDMYDLDKTKYLDIATDFQKYIETEFNPERNIEKLMEELKRREWI